MIGDVVPLVFNVQAEIYNKRGINFNTLGHLESIGLIQFNNIAGFKRLNLPKRFSCALLWQSAYVRDTPQDWHRA